jgi:alkylation response protein AidB-like acyl-CoA dehydrogenase
MDERRCVPPYVILDFGNQGILGLLVLKKYGGLALGHRDMLRVVEQIAAIDTTLALFVGIHTALGIRPIERFANAKLRDEILPLLATGRQLVAFAISEPGAGSNPRAMTSIGVPVEGGWQLKGTKIWIGNAAWAGFINVFVKLDGIAGDGDTTTGFVLRQGSPGLRQGSEAMTMGLRAIVQNSVHLEGVHVDAGHMLGEVGQGMTVAYDAMMYARLGIGSICVGVLKRSAQMILRYTSRRTVGTGRLLDNPVALLKLDNIISSVTAMEALVDCVANALDENREVPVEAFVACKTAGPELCWRGVDDLVQLLGGRGYIESNGAPQILRDVRVLRIFEGPTETLHAFLGLSVLNASSRLDTFLREELDSATIADRLTAAAQEVKSSVLSSNRFKSSASALKMAHSYIGEIATNAILLAALHRPSANVMADCGKRSIEWAEARFAESISQALKPANRFSPVVNSVQASEWINNYSASIGDIEQRAAGADEAIDAFLLQNPC